MVEPSKTSASSLPVLRHAEDLGQRPRRRVGSRAARARAARARACRAPPRRRAPSASDQVTTSSLSQRQLHREHRRGGVAEGEAAALARDPVAVRDAHARGGAVPGEDHVVVEVDRGEIGQLAVVGLEHARVEAELLRHVGDPALAEALPREHVARRAARAATTSPSRSRRCPMPARCRARSRPAGRAARGCARSPPSGDPCRPWRGASGRARRPRARRGSSPGRLAQGPDENSGRCGRRVGFMTVPRAKGAQCIGRAHARPRREATPSPRRVQRAAARRPSQRSMRR